MSTVPRLKALVSYFNLVVVRIRRDGRGGRCRRPSPRWSKRPGQNRAWFKLVHGIGQASPGTAWCLSTKSANHVMLICIWFSGFFALIRVWLKLPFLSLFASFLPFWGPAWTPGRLRSPRWPRRWPSGPSTRSPSSSTTHHLTTFFQKWMSRTKD